VDAAAVETPDRAGLLLGLDAHGTDPEAAPGIGAAVVGADLGVVLVEARELLGGAGAEVEAEERAALRSRIVSRSIQPAAEDSSGQAEAAFGRVEHPAQDVEPQSSPRSGCQSGPSPRRQTVSSWIAPRSCLGPLRLGWGGAAAS
jgi:hypothetical protein